MNHSQVIMEDQSIHVLLIEDDTNMVPVIKRKLLRAKKIFFHMECANRLDVGLNYLASKEIHVVILDLMLPDSQGLDTLRKVVAHSPKVPIVVLTGINNEDLAIKGMQVGAQDFLFKTQLDGDILLRAISYAIERKKVEKAIRASDRRFRKMIEKNADGIIIMNKDRHVLFMNPAAKVLFRNNTREIMDHSFESNMDADTITEILIPCEDDETLVAEMRMVEIEWEGENAYLLSLRDISDRKRVEDKLKRTTLDLKQSVDELQRANYKILEQQKSVIEEERLKILLQMADATANELNQPIMDMLSGIEYMGIYKNMLKKLYEHMDRIGNIGHEISDIVKKIGAFQDKDAKYLPGGGIDYLDQGMKILSVEDSDVFFNMIKLYLGKKNHVILDQAPTIDQAFHLLEHDTYNLVLLDYMLEDKTGLDFIKILNKRGLDIPVVVITGQGDEMLASQMIQAGAYDYLPKEKVRRDSLTRCINNAMGKYHLMKETRMARGRLAEMATRDALTGLYNRRYLIDSLEREISRAQRYNNIFVLCMTDLDHFKHINDTFGHPVGDMVLSDVGKILTKSIRNVDLPCRYGGEEFAILLANVSMDDATDIMERFRQRVESYNFQYDKTNFQITVSIGIASFENSDSISSAEMINRADQALYQAKELGRNKVVSFQE